MSAARSFGTLSEFLLQAGTEYFIIDVSRTRTVMDNQVFFDYESNKLPFAHPRQSHAWVCIVFWNKHLSQEHYIWFLKLPLDEQGLIQQAARDQFLQTVAEALGQQLQSMQTGQTELPENPFIFTPSQQLLADCNSFIRMHLELPPRDQSDKALQYIKAPNVQPWNELSVQDMSDLAIKISEQDVTDAFIQNLAILPHAVKVCLFSSFEGLHLPRVIVKHILQCHSNSDTNLGPLLLRSLASSQSDEVYTYLCDLLVNSDSLDTDTFIVIAGRHWQVLSPENAVCTNYLATINADTHLLHIFFKKLALADPTYVLFRGIFADLVQIPSLRVFLLAMLRTPNLSNDLKDAVATLLSMA